MVRLAPPGWAVSPVQVLVMVIAGWLRFLFRAAAGIARRWARRANDVRLDFGLRTNPISGRLAGVQSLGALMMALTDGPGHPGRGESSRGVGRKYLACW